MQIIVTRHRGLVEWLSSRGIEGRVLTHATEEDVSGKNVIGNLPLKLAAAANTVTTVEMPGLKPEQRGKDLSPEEMDAAGARLRAYKVTEV